MKKYFIILLLILTNCTSTGTIQKSSMVKDSTNKAIINFTVIQNLGEQEVLYQLFGSMNSAKIWIDGKKIGSIKNKGEIIQKLVSAGKHKISTEWSGNYFLKTNVTSDFKKGENYYFGIGVGTTKGVVELGNRASIKKLTKTEWERYTSQ